MNVGSLDGGWVKHLSLVDVQYGCEPLTIRQEAPKVLAGRLTRNFPLTTPEFPCGRVTRLWVSLVRKKPTAVARDV